MPFVWALCKSEYISRYISGMYAHTDEEVSAGIAKFREMHKDKDVIPWPITKDIISGMKPVKTSESRKCIST